MWCIMSETETVIDNKPTAGNGARIGFGRTFDKPPPKAAGGDDAELSLDSVMSIPVTVQVVLGTTSMQVADLMTMSRGAIVPLANRVGEPVDVVVNGRVVARGELVVMDDDNTRFGVSLTEIVGSRPSGKAG
jgi:flagellar motor switch protein FliN/FliY